MVRCSLSQLAVQGGEASLFEHVGDVSCEEGVSPSQPNRNPAPRIGLAVM